LPATKIQTARSKKRFLRAWEQTHGYALTACKVAGISEPTYYAWLKSDPEFKAKTLELEEHDFKIVENALFRRIRQGSDRLIEYYLKVRGKNKGYGLEVNLNHKFECNLNFENLTDEEVKTLIRLMEKAGAQPLKE
jgi:hypothetical protein